MAQKCRFKDYKKLTTGLAKCFAINYPTEVSALDAVLFNLVEHIGWFISVHIVVTWMISED